MLFTQGPLIPHITVLWIHNLNFCYLHDHGLITVSVHLIQPHFRSAKLPLAAEGIRSVC